MAIFTDGSMNTLLDLERYESGLLDVSSVEQINVTAKMALAQDQIGSDLLLFLIQRTPRDPRNLVFGYQYASNRRLKGVSDVVVTDQLKKWHALLAIALTYQDAYSNQLNDRYQAKWQRYSNRAEEAARQFYRVGAGLALNPVVKADPPLLMGVAGGALGASYYVQITWLNSAGQEGAPSDVVSIETTDEMQLLVTPPPAPQNVVAWNVYVGTAPQAISSQNDLALAPGRDWQLPATGLKLGRKPGTGQAPDIYVVDRQEFHRG
jgi:hypothetical protein